MTRTRAGERMAGERGGMAEPDQGISSGAGSPVGEDFAGMDARVRHKFDMKLPLTRAEREFFANIPGSKEISPQEMQEGRLDVEHQ